MATLYERQRSPFWYIQYHDEQGKRHNKSTGLRADNKDQTLKARILCSEVTTKELSRPGKSAIGHVTWDSWVSKFFERHCVSPRTLLRYTEIWKWLALWLQVNRYHSPRDITYARGIDYIDWRTSHKKKSGKTVGRNTAIFELKILALLMAEAVRLGHADANPLTSLKIKTDPVAKKPEMSDAEIRDIREALKEEPEWMQNAFEISLHTGCRLLETSIPMKCVNFDENKITFPTPKGGEVRAFSVPMPSALRLLFEKLRDAKKQCTVEFPFQPSRKWGEFFKKLGMPHLCFHCLRVTYINRLRRAGVPRDVAMRLVNHASSLIHQVYQRERVEDVAQWRDAVRFPDY